MKRLLCLILMLVSTHAWAATLTPVTIDTIKGERHFKLELATNNATRSNGLMHRESLPANGGMLFVFAREMRMAFWMKDTLIPLDMLFINAQGKIVAIKEQATPRSLAAIDSQAPAIAVVELAGGEAEKNSIAVGDTVTYQLPEGTRVE